MLKLIKLEWKKNNVKKPEKQICLSIYSLIDSLISRKEGVDI